MEEQKKRKLEESTGNGDAPSEEQLRSLLDPLPQPQLVDLLSKLGAQYPSIAEEIKGIAKADPVHRKLFVRGLAWNTTSESLCAAFEVHGEIEEGAVIYDKTTRIPILPSQNGVEKRTGVTFVLEKASLEVGKVGKTYQLLNSDDHANFLKKNGRNPADYRPDIVHQALLAILDSPLNKAGKVRAVYVRTEKGVLFEVKPHVRIPRTYKRFSGIMLQLLQKLSITASGKREKLLRVIKNPVTQYFPVNSRRIGFSHSSEKLVEVQDYVAAISDDMPLVFVVGAMAHGKIEAEYTDDFIAISNFPLSAACCINMICDGVHRHWKFI